MDRERARGGTDLGGEDGDATSGGALGPPATEVEEEARRMVVYADTSTRFHDPLPCRPVGRLVAGEEGGVLTEVGDAGEEPVVGEDGRVGGPATGSSVARDEGRMVAYTRALLRSPPYFCLKETRLVSTE